MQIGDKGGVTECQCTCVNSYRTAMQIGDKGQNDRASVHMCQKL